VVRGLFSTLNHKGGHFLFPRIFWKGLGETPKSPFSNYLRINYGTGFAAIELLTCPGVYRH
jgi:hypothetical protein